MTCTIARFCAGSCVMSLATSDFSATCGAWTSAGSFQDALLTSSRHSVLRLHLWDELHDIGSILVSGINTLSLSLSPSPSPSLSLTCYLLPVTCYLLPLTLSLSLFSPLSVSLSVSLFLSPFSPLPSSSIFSPPLSVCSTFLYFLFP